MGKLGFQALAWRDGVLDYCLRSRVRQLKVLDPNPDKLREIKENIPDCFVVYRMYKPFEEQQALLVDPIAGANRFADQILRTSDAARGLIDAYEGLNEPDALWGDNALRYNEWTAEYARIMHQNGCRTVAYNWSVGCPQGYYQGDGNANPDEFREGLRQHWAVFLDGLRASDYLGLHEYSAPKMWNAASWLCLRYRRVYDVLPPDCRQPLLITECGIDSGVTQPFPGLHGWRWYGYSEEEYLEQLRWYADEIDKDDYVVGAHIFQVGSYDPQWESFSILGCEKIASYIAAQTAQTKEAPMAWDRHRIYDEWQKLFGGQGYNPADAFGQIIKSNPDREYGVFVGGYHVEEPFIYAYTTVGIFCYDKRSGKAVFATSEEELPFK